MENSYKEDYLGILDGIRGLMAFWVFFGHLEQYLLQKWPQGGDPKIAVDIFMLLSGFLMAYHWQIREKRFDNFSKQTFDFYIRRFFRIAPLYYLLLTIALIGQEHFFGFRRYIYSIIPPQKMSSFHSPTDFSINFPNILSHVTFLFGLFPQYAGNNVLPDWSIGLEMQFYFIFPLLIIFLKRYGSFSMVITSFVIALVANKYIGLYVNSRLGSYPLPSLILFKINIFVAGICLAFAYLNRTNPQSFAWLILGIVSLVKTAIQVKFCALFIIFMLYFDEGRQKKEIFHSIGSGRVFRFLGDVSFSVYLLHDLILLPFLCFLLHQSWFLIFSPHKRLIVAFLFTVLPVYGFSYILFKFIELPGIELGRKFLKSVNFK